MGRQKVLEEYRKEKIRGHICRNIRGLKILGVEPGEGHVPAMVAVRTVKEYEGDTDFDLFLYEDGTWDAEHA